MKVEVSRGQDMFRGNSNHTLDPKGRLIVPARFRDELKESGVDGLMISRLDGCLVCYTFTEWVKIEAFECMLDKQARIVIPPTLRQYANLDKEIVLVGVLKHFEIWSQEGYLEQDKMHEDDLKNEETRNEIAELGL
jgi:MraZ protein